MTPPRERIKHEVSDKPYGVLGLRQMVLKVIKHHLRGKCIIYSNIHSLSHIPPSDIKRHLTSRGVKHDLTGVRIKHKVNVVDSIGVNPQMVIAFNSTRGEGGNHGSK